MRIINNSVGKVKALAKADGVAAAGEEEREIVVVVEEPQKPQQQEQQQPFHQQQQQQPQHQQLGDRIYQVTDGLKSNYTKRDYGYAFKQFLREGAKTGDLQVLLDYKPKVIEQMVIGYVEMLRDKGHASKTILSPLFCNFSLL